MFMDWLHTTAFETCEIVERTNSPNMDNGLINGHNIYKSGNRTVGSRAKFVFRPGERHLLHVISVAIGRFFTFSFDNHNLTVVEIDFVPVESSTTIVLKMAIGQCYTIIVGADQDVAAYWMRADPLTESFVPGAPNCGSTNTMDGDIKAIVRYEGSCGKPKLTAWDHDNVCEDQPDVNFVPYVALNASASGTDITESITIAQDPNTLIYK